jgi:ribose transport system substrate-binding protein
MIRPGPRLALCAIVALAACSGPGRGPGVKTLRIGVVPKGMTHEFWKTVEAGARKAATDLSGDQVRVEMIWKGPFREDDREQQMQVVEGFASQGVDGLVLAPLDRRALVRPVEEARRLGVPTVVIDSDLDTRETVSFVATDNLHSGELAAEEMARALGGRGTVLLLRYQENSASTQNREAGFEKAIARYPDIKLIASDQYAGPTRDTGKRAAENLLNRFGQDLQGIFTVNETSTAGMLLALEDVELAGKVTLLGFDATPPFETAIRNGSLHGIVVQDPFKIGYLGVKTMVDHLLGKPVERRVDTGVTVVTKRNIDLPDVQALLRPPVGTPAGQ